MEFTPQNPRQQEAFEFATNLSNLLNDGIKKGYLDRTYGINYAVREPLINYSYSNYESGIYADTNEISKL